MKKFITLLSGFTFIAAIVFFVSCQHETIDPCKGITVLVTVTKKDASTKNDGVITATATGGKDFQFSLNDGDFQQSGSFTGLSAGNYKIVTKNSYGCTGEIAVKIDQNNICAGITITVTTTKKDPATGQSNGSITASATGGSGYTYSINNGAFQSGNSFTNLKAGTYTITAKNANGCTGTVQVVLVGTDPCAGVKIGVTATKTDPASNQSNGTISVSATGGSGFTYSINNGTFQSSGSFTGLKAGTYTVTAKNSNGCTGTAQITLGSTSVDPCAGKTITVSGTAVGVTNCTTTANNGSITVSASGSTGFTFNINGGTYQAGNSFNNLAAGTYTVGAKDAAGCVKTTSVTVGTLPPGPLFTDVKNLLITKCAPCHTSSSSGGVNFLTDCEIVSRWSRIQTTTTNGSMPPGAPLTAAEKLKIANWVNAGHTYSK
ncbi:hypothetical protein [Flavihumibacter profundi]|uniref:hypothetical protein n=1 Tax=Flavihumibacter profundi TaxID=2716883 RepID=UPI001CC6662E|nr:hypothetical protein [Flavihumibacter profundi]MBZ5855579.1 hypothetical protein [Flavihumibacter profundi]